MKFRSSLNSITKSWAYHDDAILVAVRSGRSAKDSVTAAAPPEDHPLGVPRRVQGQAAGPPPVDEEVVRRGPPGERDRHLSSRY